MPILTMKSICKNFPGTVALDAVDLELKRGEIHALMGQNGAGKSTLMKIMSGVYTPSSGKIFFDGKEVVFNEPGDALKLGISIISQELSVCKDLTVAENIFLGRVPPRCSVFVDWKRMYAEAARALDRIGVKIHPKIRLSQLSVAQKQIIEIAKAVSRECKILLMDEPTSALTLSEIDSLFKLVRELKEKGLTIVYISHKLDEVFEICDRMTVLRDGRNVGVYTTSDLTPSSLTELMVGKNVDEFFRRDERQGTGPKSERIVLEAKNVCRKGCLNDVSLQLREGEVLGVYGLMGSGRTELLRALYGVDRLDSGQVVVEGKAIRNPNPSVCMRNGMALIPEERKEQGLFLELSVQQNLTIATMDEICPTGVFVSSAIERSIVEQYIDKLKIKTASRRTKIKSLSCFNQQKVILSRWLAKFSNILLLD
ncbi:MAG: sugar ABC transporter ATP-binding protein [Planctomycetaceae bacterium]|nr:sugar ABC transporter ATP-binding protein [Planctomycetaceae bacterium]